MFKRATQRNGSKQSVKSSKSAKMLNNFQVKFFILALLMANMGYGQGQPLQDHHVREERQLKSGTMSGGVAAGSTEPDVKMVANVTPAMAMPLAMNQMPLSGMQLARYPQLYYPGPGYPLPVPSLQTNIANNYPTYPDGGFPNGFGVPQGYPAGLMGGYPLPGIPSSQPPQQQLPNGFLPQPQIDNYANLNSIVNMANAQGLQGATPNSGLYQPGSPIPPFQGMPLVPGLYPTPPNAGFMPAYASAF